MARRYRKVDLVISSTQGAARVPRKRIAELVGFVAEAEGAPLAEVDLAVVTSRQIAAMNRRYLAHAGATDVLCFDLSDAGGGGIVAQIVVCGDVAARQAPRHGHGVQRELMLYVIHGLLHLMGYDDTDVRSSVKMRARQEALLREFLQRRRRRRPAKRR